VVYSDKPRRSKGIGATPKIPLLWEPGGFAVLGYDAQVAPGEFRTAKPGRKGTCRATLYDP
jgi:hypothetical protein